MVESTQAQTAFNEQRWRAMLADPRLNDHPGKVETNRFGEPIMSPPPAPRHGRLQSAIVVLLNKLMDSGEVMVECPISTADGVKSADVAWASPERWRDVEDRSFFIVAPEICVEVISPGNSEEEIRYKIAVYLETGAKEVWICSNFGEMTFLGGGCERLAQSRLCPEFPKCVFE